MVVVGGRGGSGASGGGGVGVGAEDRAEEEGAEAAHGGVGVAEAGASCRGASVGEGGVDVLLVRGEEGREVVDVDVGRALLHSSMSVGHRM